MLVWTAELHNRRNGVVRIAFPIFIGPVENESADANLVVSRGEIAFNRVPLRVKESRDRDGREIGATWSNISLGHIVEVPDRGGSVLAVDTRRPRGMRGAPFAENERLFEGGNNDRSKAAY